MNKNTSNTLFSSKSVEWATPQWLFEELNKEFHFTLDPCANETNHKCEFYFTKEDDGLSKDWSNNCVFVNPPYGKEISKWIEKSYKESLKENTTVVLLIPARTDTKYFHEYIYGKSEIRFIRGRLKFGDSNNSAPFPSMIVIFKNNKNMNYKFLREVAVKPCEPIMVTKEITEQIPTGEKDKDGYNLYDTKTETKTVESEYAKGEVLYVPTWIDNDGKEVPLSQAKVGDIVVYPSRAAKSFDLDEDIKLVSPTTIIAIENK